MEEWLPDGCGQPGAALRSGCVILGRFSRAILHLDSTEEGEGMTLKRTLCGVLQEMLNWSLPLRREAWYVHPSCPPSLGSHLMIKPREQGQGVQLPEVLHVLERNLSQPVEDEGGRGGGCRWTGDVLETLFSARQPSPEGWRFCY